MVKLVNQPTDKNGGWVGLCSALWDNSNRVDSPATSRRSISTAATRHEWTGGSKQANLVGEISGLSAPSWEDMGMSRHLTSPGNLIDYWWVGFKKETSTKTITSRFFLRTLSGKRCFCYSHTGRTKIGAEFRGSNPSRF